MLPLKPRPNDSTTHEQALELLLEIHRAVAHSETALLAGHLSELETSTSNQQMLCRKLQDLLAAPEFSSAAITKSPYFIAAVTHLREDSRVFSAVLGRMRRNLQGLRHALLGPDDFYKQQRIHKEELMI